MNRPAFILGLFLTLFGASRCTVVHAQDEAGLERTLLAVVVHEGGVDAVGDVAGIYAVLVRGAARQHISPVAFAHRYSPRLFGGRTDRPWAARLDTSCTRPRGFAGRWEQARAEGVISRRDACLVLVERVRQVIAAPPTCDADDWGSDADMDRARRLGRRFEIVDCGASRNLFSRRLRWGSR